MFVVTIDQQGSRRVGDRVDELLATLRARGDLHRGSAGVAAPFERTVGDEVQCVLVDPALAVDVTLAVLRLKGWSVGIGAGPVDEPLPASSRAGSGPAFILARDAVEQAKSRLRVVPLVVHGHHEARAREAEAVLVLLGATLQRRTPAGWEVVDAVERSGETRQDEIARRIGVSQQAVSQRLRTALWAEEQAARPVAARLLAAAAVDG
ncbi:MarR family transcriptional regulator [Cellulomonas chengniuliangii]|uniref:MarR family transcriptional regulator n=1 Tax=Cellulomonas chengniuliangii TaxID=2968084 RepID=UPI001D0E19F1|nr:MarR family transcriptional regulator [Cellulomonas chengniuliangii]MCC2317434.1 MarR family transcriptional regulator [Cellulomonas chengniuliangii]